MATSGDSTYNNTRNEIIEAALRKCGQLAEGETASAQQLENASGDLERMIKGWQADGVHLWKYGEIRLFLTEGTYQYSLGPSGAHCALVSDIAMTNLSAAASSGASTITVDSITDIASGDNVGVVQDDGTIHWTTVNGAPSGSTVTLTAVLTDDAADDANVYVYTTKVSRPLRIEHARFQTDDTTETEMISIGRDDFFRRSNKTAEGVSVEYHYSPALTNGILYIWPAPQSVDNYMNMSAYLAIEDFDAAGNNPDFPAEWLQAMIWGLASEIAPEYGVDTETITTIAGKADYWFDKINAFDTDHASVFFRPDFT